MPYIFFISEVKPTPPPTTPQSLQPPVTLSPGSGDHAGGLAPPPEPSVEGDEQEGETPKEGEEVVETAPKPKKIWIDFEQFCKCFK